MKTKMTMLGSVIAALGCTVAMAAEPQQVSHEALAPAAAPTKDCTSEASLSERVVNGLADAMLAVAVLPAG